MALKNQKEQKYILSIIQEEFYEIDRSATVAVTSKRLMCLGSYY